MASRRTASARSALHIVDDHPSRSVAHDRIRACIAALLSGEDASLVDLNVILTDHDTVHRLNREYLSHDYRTDVLAFSLHTPSPQGEEAEPGAPFAIPPDEEAQEAAESSTVLIDGEVYVDLDTAAERCDAFGAAFEDEALRYIVHGVLHLAGYDDGTEAERSAMRALEDRYVQ